MNKRIKKKLESRNNIYKYKRYKKLKCIAKSIIDIGNSSKYSLREINDRNVIRVKLYNIQTEIIEILNNQ